jgi:hypothetical protein
MRDQLIAALRQVPFAPFAVTLQSGEVYTVDGVEGASVAKDLWAVVDRGGVIRIHSFEAIRSIVAASRGGDIA